MPDHSPLSHVLVRLIKQGRVTDRVLANAFRLGVITEAELDELLLLLLAQQQTAP